MWKAYLESENTINLPADVVVVNIRFDDADTGRTITKNYQLHAGNFGTVQDVKDLVVVELDKLSKLDSLTTIIRELIGQEIE